MKCKQCNKEFKPKRKDAVFCSSACRLKSFRNDETLTGVSPSVSKTETIGVKSETDDVKSETIVETTGEKTATSSSPKDPWLCKINGCNLKALPGHNDMCIYHWRKSEGLATISDEIYNTMNTSVENRPVNGGKV